MVRFGKMIFKFKARDVEMSEENGYLSQLVMVEIE